MFQRAGVIVYRAASTLAVIVILRALLAFAYRNVEDALLMDVIPYSLVALLIWGAGRSAYQFLSRI
jgi:hypothetical protein